jgi:hypothetical protein
MNLDYPYPKLLVLGLMIFEALSVRHTTAAATAATAWILSFEF